MDEQVKRISDDTEEFYPKKKRRQGGGILRVISAIVLIAALAIFCYAAFNLYSIYSGYKAGTDEYDKLKEYVTVPKESVTASGVDLSESGEVDFAALSAVNADVVAWIRFPAFPTIDYPIVHTTDNTTYLNTTFERNTNSAGTLFTDMYNKSDFSDPNVIVYGHALKNGSMFGSLKKFRDQEFYAENPYFYIYTPDGGIYKYQICAVYETEDTSDTYTIDFSTAEDYLNYLNMITEKAYYGTGAALTQTSRLVTLSTCTNATATGRLVVQGVRTEVVREAEPPVAELHLP